MNDRPWVLVLLVGLDCFMVNFVDDVVLFLFLAVEVTLGDADLSHKKLLLILLDSISAQV